MEPRKNWEAGTLAISIAEDLISGPDASLALKRARAAHSKDAGASLDPAEWTADERCDFLGSLSRMLMHAAVAELQRAMHPRVVR